MEIVRKATGVDAIVALEAGVVFLDPGLSCDEAIAAIWNAVPQIDCAVIESWMPQVIPFPPSRHKSIHRAARQNHMRAWLAMSAASVAATFVLVGAITGHHSVKRENPPAATISDGGFSVSRAFDRSSGV